MQWTETILNPCGFDDPDPRWIDPSLPDFVLITKLAREAGYSIGIHGSLKRDVDLIAVPWTDDAVGNYALIGHICQGINARMTSGPEYKPHGRVAVTLLIDGYFKPIDLSIMPGGTGNSKLMEVK